jgi:hypothetical protein
MACDPVAKPLVSLGERFLSLFFQAAEANPKWPRNRWRIGAFEAASQRLKEERVGRCKE